MSLQAIYDDCDLAVDDHEQVMGGDINRSYCLYSGKSKYFLKVNDESSFPGMFEKEAGGLSALREGSKLVVPQVIKHGAVKGLQYLLLEWLDTAAPGGDFWEEFGKGLALQHQQPQSYFGWKEDNYIGSLQQVNNQYNNWHEFYTHSRVMPLVKKLFDKGRYSSSDVILAETLCNKLAELFPSEPPALLHGDLWSGNFLVSTKGPAIFDPAVYYGHREMDIGMSRLFGGFDRRLYNAYNDVYPLAQGWEQRLQLTQLYPLLVHAVLFGGHYGASARDIMKQYS